MLMSRLYRLDEFYGLSLGKELYNFNGSLVKQHQQTGVWLADWIENERTNELYKKKG